MKVLVTGANGLLGHHVVNKLLSQQYQVKILVRNTRNIYFNLSEVEVFEGNFCNYDDLKPAMANCDAVIHIAAVTATNLLYYSDYKKVNVSGTLNIINVMKEYDIKNLIYISTANTIGYGTKQNCSDENSEISYPFTKSFYARSKKETENVIDEIAQNSDIRILIIHPTFMVGSMDTKPSSGKLLLMGYGKRWMFIPSGGKNFVSVDDVANATCEALTKGKSGEHYLLCGKNLSFKEFYQLQSRVGGYSQTQIIVPDFVLKLAAKVGDLLRCFRLKTDLCSMNMNQLLIQEYYCSGKAENEFGFVSKPLEISVDEALQWFRQSGKIK